MDILIEFVFTAVLEGIFGLTVKNPKVKTWVKTLVFLLLAEGVALAIGILSFLSFKNGNTSGGIGCMVIAVLLGIGFLIGGIYGHKRDWKQDDYR